MRSRAIERDKVNNQCARNYVKQTMTFIIHRKSAFASENGGVCARSRREGGTGIGRMREKCGNIYCHTDTVTSCARVLNNEANPTKSVLQLDVAR